MTKIDKTDIENINLIIKETKIKKVSKIKLKKNNYEIEITTNDFNPTNQNLKQIKTLPEKKESPTKTEIENKEEAIITSLKMEKQIQLLSMLT